MKTTIKYISMLLVHAMMIMTFILSPIPGVESSYSYAADSETTEKQVEENPECEDVEENADGTPGVYKAGCKFNKDLATTSLKNHYPDGIKGIIEQFIGAVFALIGITLFWKPIPAALIECPSHVGSKVTFPIIQAGSLAYLMGEIAANNEFKKGSKVAVDKKFGSKNDESVKRKGTKEEIKESRKTAKKAMDQNNKQLEAYDALAKIYGHQVSGLEKKIQFATAAEAAFVTAEVFEITDIATNIATAETEVTTVLGANLTSTGVLAGLSTTIGAGSLTLCTPLVFAISLYLGSVAAADAALLAQASAEKIKEEAETTVQSTSVTTGFNPVGFIGMSTVGSVTSLGVHTAEVVADTALGTAHDTENISLKAARLTEISGIGTAITACVTAMASASVATLGVGAAAFSAAGTAVAAVPEAIAVIEGERKIPLICSGTMTLKGADLDTPIPLLSDLANKIDAAFPEADVANNETIKTKENLYYVKTILHNFFHRMAFYKINQNKFQNPEKRISEVAATSKYVDFLVEESMKKIHSTDFEKEVEILEGKFNNDKIELASNLYQMMNSFKFDLVKSAEAGSFKELLNIGVKVVMLHFTVGKWLRNNAFPKPKNRIITWAIMSLANLAIIKFDNDSKSDAKKRLDLVLEEKRKFAASHMIKTEIASTGDESGSGEDRAITMGETTHGNSNGKGIIGCAVPKGNSFAPTVCPSVIPKNRFRINTGGASFSGKGSLLGKQIAAIGNVGYGAASGQQYSKPTLMNASISEVSDNRKALAKQRDLLRDKLDKLELRGSKNKKLKKGSISHINTKFKRLFRGDPSSTGVTNAMAASMSIGKIPNLEKLKKQQKKNAKINAFSIPSYTPPSGGSDFDFDLDGGEGGTEIDDIAETPSEGKEENLNEFVINNEEINENPSVNIFKLLSNRYLMQYPTLLNEVKSKRKK